MLVTVRVGWIAVLERPISNEQKAADRAAVIDSPNFAIVLDFLQARNTASLHVAIRHENRHSSACGGVCICILLQAAFCVFVMCVTPAAA